MVLAPGPEREVQSVRRFFQMYTEMWLGYSALARLLNTERLTGLRGLPWTEIRVRVVMTNENYRGNLVYNRRCRRIRSRRHANCHEAWQVGGSTHRPSHRAVCNCRV